MKRTIKVKRHYTEYVDKVEIHEVPIWWVRFLKFVFKEQWASFKWELQDALEDVAKETIKQEMKKYENCIDSKILSKIKISKPAVRVKHWAEFDIPDLAPGPNIINGIAYPKRLITVKHQESLVGYINQ